MKGLKLHTLEIRPEFRDLIPPLHAEEYKTLEESILREGCREAVTVWNGAIVDGHNRYSICHKHNIPFKVSSIDFKMEEEAISWICDNQLGRRSISPETRKYLIGKRYAAEKIVGATNKEGINQHTAKKEVGSKVFNQPKMSEKKTAVKLGNEYNISHATVCKYNIYSREIDKISASSHLIADSILSGKLKLSHARLLEISNYSKKELAVINDMILKHVNDNHYLTYADIRNELRIHKMKTIEPKQPKQVITEPVNMQIKQLPKFDPDAELTSLTLTIPSWIGSIARARDNSDLNIVSHDAIHKLKQQLYQLTTSIYELMQQLEEVNR